MGGSWHIRTELERVGWMEKALFAAGTWVLERWKKKTN